MGVLHTKLSLLLAYGFYKYWYVQSSKLILKGNTR